LDLDTVRSSNPAVVAQAAVKRLPRAALLGLCVVYVLAGFLGRDGWKNADMASMGFMLELAANRTDWWQPTLVGIASEQNALFPYWLGAWMIQIAPSPEFALWLIRLPFALLLTLAMSGTWYGTYYLAKSPEAQPVAFAFGGQAKPSDYARTVADGGLLALIACLGLAQLGHETTPALAQLGFVGMYFYGVSALPYGWRLAGPATLMGQVGLTLSGAPMLAILYGAGCLFFGGSNRDSTEGGLTVNVARRNATSTLVLGCILSALIATFSNLWQWTLVAPKALWVDWNGYFQLLVWFTWPAGPLALWAVWRWRRQIGSRHIALPLWLLAVTLLVTLFTESSDRVLLLALPAIASLAAFALPTLRRQMASLIDWFTLLFFSGCGLVVWVVWLAMQTGVPSQPAVNVARLAPGFQPQFSVITLLLALAATTCWAALVRWRTHRHRAALWKSLVLPAGGAVWCWTLLMTLWLPLLDYTQGYSLLTREVALQLDAPGCAEVQGLGVDQIAALKWAIDRQLVSAGTLARCTWLIAQGNANGDIPPTVDTTAWAAKALIRHPADASNAIWVMQRR
jgi:hypothetical protein